MNTFLEENGEDRFAKGQSRRNLRVRPDAAETKTHEVIRFLQM
jgi:hypothetical protein